MQLKRLERSGTSAGLWITADGRFEILRAYDYERQRDVDEWIVRATPETTALPLMEAVDGTGLDKTPFPTRRSALEALAEVLLAWENQTPTDCS